LIAAGYQFEKPLKFISSPAKLGVREARPATFRQSGKVGALEIRFDCFRIEIRPAGMLPGEKNRGVCPFPFQMV
jgi:hypothetical protein